MCVSAELREPSRWERCVTNILRWLPVALLALHVSFDIFDPLLNWIWTLLLASGFLDTPMAEAKIAGSGFLFGSAAYSVLDLAEGLKPLRYDGFSKDSAPLHVCLCLCLFTCVKPPVWPALTVLVVFIAFRAGTVAELRKCPWMRRCVLKVFGIYFTYMASIATLHLLKEPAPAGMGPITASRFCVEVAFGIFAYDFLFFFMHLALHRHCSLSWLHGHSQHHRPLLRSGRLCALDTVNHNAVDGALQVLTNILVQNLNPLAGPKHKLSRLAHNALVTYLLVESHSGYDAPWAVHRLWPRLFGGAARHHLHHRDGAQYHQQFFTYLDDWWNARFPANRSKAH